MHGKNSRSMLVQKLKKTFVFIGKATFGLLLS